MTSQPVVLEMQGIGKRFGATQALVDMHLRVRPGEIHALMGENGAGKSTLMKVLSGVYQPDEGRISLDGQAVSIQGPAHARKLGISLIYQELSIAPHLSVAHNIFMGSEPRLRFGRVDAKTLFGRAEQMLGKLGAGFSAHKLAGELSLAEQQQVEIARALVHEGRVLIMDEPTASLSERETQALFKVICQLRDDGLAVIYISHRMAEVAQLADRVTVLRDGAFVGELPRSELAPGRIVQMMVGRPLADFYQHQKTRQRGEPLLEVSNLSGGDRVRGCSFTAHAREVLGLAGLVGAGRTEIARMLFGADPMDAGAVRFAGQPVQIRSPLQAIQLGMAYVPEDRKGQGLFLQLSALINVSMNVTAAHSHGGVLRQGRLARLTRAAIDRLGIKVPGPQGIVGALSGGNQQKVLLARWLEIKPRVLILDEPTRGVDVGAKSEIYKLIHELADAGVAVIVISSELPEIVGISDRVLVMREGRFTGELRGDEINQERIMALATHAEQAAA